MMRPFHCRCLLISAAVFATWAPRIPSIKQALDLDNGALGIALGGLAVGLLVGTRLTGRMERAGQLEDLRSTLMMQGRRWRTVGDSRVRTAHRAREGQIFAWDKPPSDGHPGQPINCRCYAEPIIPD